MAVSVGLALLAAAVFAGAAALQHRANHSTVDRVGSAGRAALALLGNRIWLAGLVGNVVGFLLHSAALHLGDLAVVQAVLVTQLLFALPLAAARTGVTPRARDWTGTVAVGAGIVVLLLVRGDRSPGPPTDRAVLTVVAAGVAVMLALLAAARAAPARGRTVLVGLAAGTGFSVTATLVLAVADRVARHGLLAGLLDWPTVVLAGWGLATSVLVQVAFASGALPAALTAMTTADPLASWSWSVLILDAVPLGPVALAGYGVAGALLAVGVLILAYSPTRTAPDPVPADHVAAASGVAAVPAGVDRSGG